MVRSAFFAAAVIIGSTAPAMAETTITVGFSYRILKVDEPQEWLPGRFSASLKISDDGSTEVKSRDSSGELPVRKSKLGVRGADPRSVYRVLDDNTIQATRQFESHKLVVTAKVTGSTCEATVHYNLKPGYDAYVMYSPKYGKELHFRDMRDQKATCSIE